MTLGEGLFSSGTFGVPVSVGWVPGDEWPGPLEGGAASPKWGGYVRLWVRAAIAAGNTFHLGSHEFAELDAGNVMAGATPVGRTAIDRLWVDLTCDVLDVDIQGGASKGQGIFSKADAGTCTVTLLDPDGKYDPLNPVPPWQYQGRTRLLPGVPVEVFAEVVDPYGTIVGSPGVPDSYEAPQRITTSGTSTHVPTNKGKGVRLRFVRAGRITKIRYHQTDHVYSSFYLDVWDQHGTRRIHHEVVDAATRATGWYEETLPTPVDVEADVFWTVSTSSGGILNCTQPPPTVTDTADMEFAGWYESTNNSLWPNIVDATFGVNIEPTFEPLIPGTPPTVEGIGTVVSRHYLFTGTADSWGEDWTPRPSQRTATLVASDVTKQFVRFDRPATTPTGVGDTTEERVQRIVDYYGWSGTVEAGTSVATLDSTTHVENAWEQLNRAVDDELGMIYITAQGNVRWTGRTVWFTLTPPVLTLGCGDPTFYDVLVDASPSNLDIQMKNTVYAARTGGSTQTASNTTSIDQYGPYEYKRTDLGLADNSQVGEWATTVVELYAFPQIVLADVAMQPALHDQSWESWGDVLGVKAVSDLVRVVWAPPDRPQHVVDTYVRVVGYKHTITHQNWEIEWQLVDAQALRFSGSIFTLGPSDQDQLDAGWVLGFTSTGGT